MLPGNVKTIEDLDALLDEQEVTVFGGRKYYYIMKRGPSEYRLQDSAFLDSPYTDLGALLVQMVMIMVQEAE